MFREYKELRRHIARAQEKIAYKKRKPRPEFPTAYSLHQDYDDLVRLNKLSEEMDSLRKLSELYRETL